MVRCDGCRFWKPGRDEGEDTQGECRRYAPRPRAYRDHYVADLMGHLVWAAYQAAGTDPSEVDYRREPDATDDVAMFPMTSAYEWCGEYEGGK
jgi:hypothetical protein